jgi:IMP cyclohydrolase
MVKGLEALADMEYPGRFIILGVDDRYENEVAVYGITGRSESSRARKLVVDEAGSTILVRPTSEDALKKGNPDLLIYPAVNFESALLVSNGAQTVNMKRHSNRLGNPMELLVTSMLSWDYEPDAPNHTPRISGAISLEAAALSIVRRAEPLAGVASLPDHNFKKGRDILVERSYFEVPLFAGQGKMISTYSGENKNPLPSFQGSPLDVLLVSETAGQVAEDVYLSLAPKDGRDDYRVAVAVVFTSIREFGRSIAVMNRYGHDGDGPSCVYIHVPGKISSW